MISTCRPCIHVLETNQGYLCVLTFYKAVITFTENVQCLSLFVQNSVEFCF